MIINKVAMNILVFLLCILTNLSTGKFTRNTIAGSNDTSFKNMFLFVDEIEREKPGFIAATLYASIG